MDNGTISWHTETRPTQDLRELENNPRKITEEAFDKLKARITARGFHDVIKVDTEGYILSGNQRKRALVDLGIPTVNVLVPSRPLTKEERDKVVLESNRNDGIWDFDILGNEFELDTLIDVGFDPKELGLGGPDPKDDAVPEAQEETIAKRGDIYFLGKHRVMCGDSTSPEDMQMLMAGTHADMLLTDPPYNVDYTGKTKDALKIDNDSMEDSEYQSFLVAALSNAKEQMKPGAVFYIWHADSEGFNVRSALNAISLQVRQCLIWAKNSMVMGRQDYHWKHEPCLYGWKDGAAHLWNADRSQVTILNFDRPTTSKEHPTMKPVELLAYQIGNNTKGEDIVLDPFLGSGSTLIAAQKLGRVCYGMELDPRFVDVIVKRWEEYTGEKAVKA